MKTIITTILIALLAIVSAGYMGDADARKRFGGGKSTGMQRDSVQKDAAIPPKPATPPQASSAAAPAATAATAGAATAATKTGASRWLGPLAGLAAGGLLAAMFMGGAFDGIKFFDILLIAGLAFAAFMIFRAFMRKKAAANGNGSGTNDLQYAGAGGAYSPQQPAPEPVRTQYSAQPQSGGRIAAPEIGSRLASGNASAAEIEAATANPRIPADFEVAPFERQAQSAFIRLQAANDAKDLNDIRDFTSPEMFAEISMQIKERGDATQRTEVTGLAVKLLEVATENNRAIASVRYSGTIREDVGALPEPFDEVWHVTKELGDKNSTWRIAGIQQLA
jgi:predicted lipid-binding transport protein (Tim44 family)